MGNASKIGIEVLSRISGEPDLLLFHCPGCGYCHHLDPKKWTWNGDMIKPTVSPSLLVNKAQLGKDPRCHFFIRDGKIQYLGDCSHELKGRTIDMVPWPWRKAGQ